MDALVVTSLAIVVALIVVVGFIARSHYKSEQCRLIAEDEMLDVARETGVYADFDYPLRPPA